MQRAILSTIALYRHDPTLFDGFVVPSGMNKQDFIDRLLIEQGEQEVLYTNPDIMRRAIGAWSRGRLPMWQKLYDMQAYEYNPIWNVDGETWHDGTSESHGTSTGSNSEQRTYSRDRDQTDTLTNTHNDTRTPNLTETRTPNLTETRTPNLTETNTPAGGEETTNYLSADNTEGWSNDTRSTTTYQGRTDTKQQTGTEQTTNTGTEQTTETGTEQNNGGYTNTDVLEENIDDTESRTGSNTGKDDRTGAESWHEKRQGNIGVTMTQQLLQAERELWESNDVEGFMINEYKREFCIMVY